MLRAVALVVLGASAGPWGELRIAGAGTFGSGSGLTSNSGAGSLTLEGYLHHRLLDDEAPLSLQPYLQRAGSIEASFAASGFSTDAPGFAEPFHGTSFGGELSVDAYTGQVLTLYGSASFSRDKTGGGFAGFPGSEYLLPRVTFGPGLRFGDTRITVGYTWAPTIQDGTYDGRGFGEAYLRITSVLARRFFLTLLGEIILSGGLGSIDVALFPWRTFGFTAGFEFAQGAIFYDTRRVYRRWQASGGLNWWITPRAGLGLEYRFIHTEALEGPASPFDTHRISLAFGLRLD